MGSIKKSTKRFTQKKVASYDTKLIAIIVAVILAITAIIVTILIVNTALNSYVAHVNKKGVRDYEYKYFLKGVVSDMQTEAQEALDEDTEFDAAAFWTDEKKDEAEKKALDDVVEWESQYLVAVDKGFKLTKEEETNLRTNIEYEIQYYFQLYQQYGMASSYADIMAMMGIDDLEEYEAIMCKYATISKYTDDLSGSYKLDDLYFTDKDGNKTTGEAAITAKYNSDPEEFRRVQMRTLVIEKADEPVKPTEVKDPGEAPNSDETSEEYIAWKSNKDKFDKYKTDLETYNTKKEQYDKDNAEFEAKVEAMYEALKNNGKFTGKGFADVDTGEKDAEGNAVTAPKDYTDATLEDIAGTEGVYYKDTKGLYSFMGCVDDATDVLSKYAVSLEWADDARTSIKSILTEATAEKAEDAENAEEDAFDNDYTTSKLKELKLIEDDQYYYITECENILDINTSREEAPTDSESTEDLSVRAVIFQQLAAEKAQDVLNENVKANASKFEAKKLRPKVMREELNSVLGIKA